MRTKIGSEGKEQWRKSRRWRPKTTVNAGNASVAYKTCGKYDLKKVIIGNSLVTGTSSLICGEMLPV